LAGRIWAAAHLQFLRAAVFFVERSQQMGFEHHFGNKNQHSVHEEVPMADKASE
jgi:hypothetical protein